MQYKEQLRSTCSIDQSIEVAISQTLYGATSKAVTPTGLGKGIDIDVCNYCTE